MTERWRYKFHDEYDDLAAFDKEVDKRLSDGAKLKQTGNYAADARELRRARRLYWDLYGPDGEKLLFAQDPRQTLSKEEKEKRKEEKRKKKEDEAKRVNLERVSQRLQLERHDLETKIGETRREFGKLARRKLVLEEEWKKIHADRASLEEDKTRFQSARKSPWFQSNILPTSDMRRVRISVGGQLFETSERVLKRDPGSLLAALVQPDSPLQPNEKGCYVIDRDWYLFRLILTFLRDGVLPDLSNASGEPLISNLYKEADYYNLETLRCAIREYLDPYQIVEKSAAVPLSRLHKLEAKMLQTLKGNLEELSIDDGFHYDPPAPKKSEPGKKENLLEWWDKAEYHGKDFSLREKTLSDLPTKWAKKGNALEKAKAAADQAQPFTTKATWFKDFN